MPSSQRTPLIPHHQALSAKDRIHICLYHDNLFSAQRTALCLAIHAVILGRANVPRMYLPDSLLSPANPAFHCRLLEECLLSDIQTIETETHETILAGGICLENLTMEMKSEILLIVEECMQYDLGPGGVHYSLARFTPFTSEDSAELISAVLADWSGDSLELILKLKQRCKAKSEFVLNHGARSGLASLGSARDSFMSRYRLKAETLWQQLWKDASHYHVATAEEKALRFIKFAEDI